MKEHSFSYEEFTTRNIGFVTEAEQDVLRKASVLIIGVGGMGGVALQCLVRAGVGRFIFADIDTFEVSNLNRQIFSNVENLGKDKAETTRLEILRINPLCVVENLGSEWLSRLDEILPQVDVVVNGCDDARASIQLMRQAKVHGKTVIDAFASPLPSVYVVAPSDPRPEETMGYPSVGRAVSELTHEDAKECAACEIQYVMAQSSSASHVVLDIAAEMISGKRKRISFAPMVWATGILMSYEVVRILLRKPGGPGPRGIFLNPWSQRYERARRGPITWLKLFLVRRFLNHMSKKALAVASVMLALSFMLTGCLDAKSTSMQDYAGENGPLNVTPAAHFLMSDYGGLNSDTLNTNAIPWKVAATYILIQQNRETGIAVRQSSLPEALRRYGFITPTHIDNWPAEAPQPKLKTPAGLVHGIGEFVSPQAEISAIEIGNVNCAACHAGTNYDKNGKPTLNLWLGAPNTSIDIDSYTNAVFKGLKEAVKSREKMIANVKKVFPELSPQEELTLNLSFGFVKARVNKMASTVDHATPFSNGNPGVTNGVASLKRMLKVIDLDKYHTEETAFTAVPDLSDRYLRSSLLYDGVYSLKGENPFMPRSSQTTPRSHMLALGRIVGFFNVPVQGQSPQAAEKNLPKALAAVSFLENYRRPDFPGTIDDAQAERGRAIFTSSCAGCHGNYAGDLHNLHLEMFPNKLIPLAAIGTDPQRARLLSPQTAAAVKRSNMGKYMNANVTGGYIAPILTGLWASAPYLHNGSVPTLWHLMNPETRPAAFQVGGHELDFEKVGIAGDVGANGVYVYPRDYKAWSRPYVYNTRDLGRSNRGHEKQFAPFTQDQKRDLIEFLKLL